nr:MAG TPA: hypothetical protein [Caudoviricetes sp.]DAY62245.1 MAG TPA: hypothetical protein [Caudoviricetes sp.]
MERNHNSYSIRCCEPFGSGYPRNPSVCNHDCSVQGTHYPR